MNHNGRVKVRGPATVGNVSCGFDVLGFALQDPADTVELILNDSGQITISGIRGPHASEVPLDPERNTCGVAARAFLQKVSPESGLEIRLQKDMPVKSGLGSSAAGAAATLAGLNELFEGILEERELLACGLQAEKAACGSIHGDNIAPALLGGFVLISSYQPLHFVRLPTPEELWYAVAHPRLAVQTRQARQILPRQIPLTDARRQWGNLGGMVSGLFMGDYDLIGRSIEDRVAEPGRSRLIPGFEQIREKIRKGPALGGGISGSGPAVFALCRGADAARQAVTDLTAVFTGLGIANHGYTGPVNTTGATVSGVPPE